MTNPHVLSHDGTGQTHGVSLENAQIERESLSMFANQQRRISELEEEVAQLTAERDALRAELTNRRGG